MEHKQPNEPNYVEAPNGYKMVRIGVHGRKPTLCNMAWDDMSSQQKKDYKYRLKTREKRLAYQREYYEKKKALKTASA